MRKYAFFILIIIPCSCCAIGFGNFHGRNTKNETVILEIVERIINEYSLSDHEEKLIVKVKVESKQNSREYSDVCHRKMLQDIFWCDGNKSSPMFGTTYKFDHEILGTYSDETPNSEIWHCINGCGVESPNTFRYDY